MKNKGFTLVEFMIAIGMASIIALGISYMMISTSRNYTGVQKELTLQSDAQIIINTISDYLLQGNNVNYNDTGDILTIYHADGITSTFYPKEIIWLNTATKKIYICSAESTTDQSVFTNLIVTPSDDLEQYLLGKNVDEFTATIGSNGVIRISLELSLDGASYSISNTIKMRNEMKSYN